MPEIFHDSNELNEKLKPTVSAEKIKTKPEREITETEKKHGSKEHLSKLTKSVEKQAISGKEYSRNEHDRRSEHPVLINKQLKDMAFSRTLTRIRKKMPIQSRVFSKIIHNPVVDRSSEIIGKTVVRPLSMLTGAFTAFVGTSALLWVTKHYGYEYNYLVVIILFIAGAILGVILEALWSLIHSKHR